MFCTDSRILIVDDMLTMRKMVKQAFKTLGFKNIVEAVSGPDAYRKLIEANDPFQLIVSDWNMAEESGLDLLKSIRRNPDLRDLPFILLTEESGLYQVGLAVEAGVSGYIVKPFTAEGLRQKLEQTSIHRPQRSAA